MRRSGFTLIELLIVVVIIGILAVIAIPNFDNTKAKANAASIKSDLRNLAVAQEAYYYDHGEYTQDMNALKVARSPGVNMNITAGNERGWAAWAEHPQSRPLQCGLYIGSSDGAPGYVTAEGKVSCNNP